ncbi:Os06g0139200 [Oryza sativa Japonica Group]|uniref:Os06g0139200 protein n=3 Tax=Oryza sativa TaxID=4530 RepID=B9FRE4_ORYSJ|nr:hypothetical protein OsI_21560 [Oryza sativa Indica Group]EEE65055.1 hypothetical protein OsJ_20059 [Oryza sativa Japonica Group]KAB8101130.1 hypothetical protein EE612_031819 [Oryza sativa]BAS96066.1 Os06g0139200 [Oryza sativa Japonica Group]
MLGSLIRCFFTKLTTLFISSRKFATLLSFSWKPSIHLCLFSLLSMMIYLS